jgi:hypothetical protein
MTTPEAAFAARVRDGLRPFDIDTERIENRVNLGVSDMLVGAGDRFVSIELKAVSRGLKIALRPHQIAFLTGLKINGIDDVGVMYKITTIISGELKINMQSITIETDDGLFEGIIKVYVRDTEQLNLLMDRLKALEGILSVTQFEQEVEKHIQ